MRLEEIAGIIDEVLRRFKAAKPYPKMLLKRRFDFQQPLLQRSSISFGRIQESTFRESKSTCCSPCGPTTRAFSVGAAAICRQNSALQSGSRKSGRINSPSCLKKAGAGIFQVRDCQPGPNIVAPACGCGADFVISVRVPYTCTQGFRYGFFC